MRSFLLIRSQLPGAHKKKPMPNVQHGLVKKIRAGRKPSSVSLIAQGGEHLSGPSIARRHERPTRKSRTGRPYPLAGDASLCGLAPGGVFQALPVTRESGGLLPHRFTLTPLRGGLLFCGTIHGVAPCPVSGPPCPAELGLSSPRCRGAITSPALKSKNKCSRLQAAFSRQGTRTSRHNRVLFPYHPPTACCLPSTEVSRLSLCSPAHPLPCFAPLGCIVPRRSRSLQ